MTSKNKNQPAGSAPAGSTETLPDTPTPEMVAAIETLFANICPTVTPVVTVDPVQVFADLFVSASSSADELSTVSGPVVDAYRAIPGAGRGRAVARAMSVAMRAGSDPDRVADLSDACTAAPVGKPAVTVDPVTVLGMRLTSLRIATLAILADAPVSVVTQASELADLAMSGQHTPTDQDAILSAARRAVSAVSRGGSTGGSRGPVTARRDASAVPAGTSASRLHVDHVMALQAPGTHLSTREIANLPSPAYPAGSTRPSAGALANVVRDRKSGTPITGETWVGTARPDGATRQA